MKFKISIIAAALAVSAGFAQAQYTGPSATPTTVKQLLTDGKDDQYATLKGRIIKRIGDDNYLFSDGTGELEVEISDSRFPADQPISADSEVQLSGEFDKELIGAGEFEVKEFKLIN